MGGAAIGASLEASLIWFGFLAVIDAGATDRGAIGKHSGKLHGEGSREQGEAGGRKRGKIAKGQ